ncbi:4-(cytidine 5'-diphospho)-2-C-methyl-D-erythritol kinase [Candidatus Margulisiibacteriota bacterium]
MSKELKLRANAKINLFLKVLGRRDDGYHDIETDMQSISLHDIITLTLNKGKITVTCDNPEVPKGKDNLAFQAAELYLGEIGAKGEGVAIDIKKNIPLASGLGGGSADAAAVLHGMNLLHSSKLHKDKLHELAVKIGSDVPFCLVGGTAKCTGRGEEVKRRNPETGNTYIFAMPDVRVSAKEIYDGFDELKKKEASSLNDLEQVTFAKFPDIGKLKDKLVAETNVEWFMSGSGPVLFAEFGDLAEIDNIVGRVAKITKYHVAMRMNEGVSALEG